jgi:pimeloyl-ACP methyl ester carboxylesterase
VTEVQLSTDSDFHFEILRDLSAAVYGGADIGEVLTAANLIVPGNFESYYLQFNNIANKVLAWAKSIDPKKYPVSASDTYFRAATYFRSADFFLHGNQSDPRIISLWNQQIDAFDTGMSLLPAPGRRINIQAKNFTIPALFFAPDGPVKRRPTIIIGGGYDGGQEELYTQMGKAAVERGWNYISYEGPGMATPRRFQNLGFTIEWETVVTPVVDYLHTLKYEVDTSAIALIGLSFGGLLAPRAAAFEHRLTATMAFDGLTDFGPFILQNFGTQIVDLFAAGNATAFDNTLNAYRASPNAGTQAKWLIDQGMWSMNTLSPFDWMVSLHRWAWIIEQMLTTLDRLNFRPTC